MKTLLPRFSPELELSRKLRILALSRSDNDGPHELLSRRMVNELARASYCDRAGLRRRCKSSSGGARASSSGNAIHVRFQDSPSWFTPQGVWRKRKAIERKGLPDMKGRRFITLSLDPEQFGYCPLTAYLVGKDKLRRFLEAGRIEGLWERDAWWCWKMEFQRNGWAHWHLIIDRTRKFSVEELRKVHKIWGLGRTNVRRISKSNFGYQFKYAFKGVYMQDDDRGLAVPQWFLDYYVAGSGEVKPKSFARARFWQTSKGFYTGPKQPSPKSKEPQSTILPFPVAFILECRNSAIIVIARRADGRFLTSKRLKLGCSYKHFIRVHLWGVEHGKGCSLSGRSFVLDHHGINQTIEENQKWILTKLLQENRLTLRRALSLRQQRINLERC